MFTPILLTIHLIKRQIALLVDYVVGIQDPTLMAFNFGILTLTSRLILVYVLVLVSRHNYKPTLSHRTSQLWCFEISWLRILCWIFKTFESTFPCQTKCKSCVSNWNFQLSHLLCINCISKLWGHEFHEWATVVEDKWPLLRHTHDE